MRPIFQLHVNQYLKYHREFNEYMKDFKKAKADLLARKEDIERQFENSLGSKWTMPKYEVKSWLRKVDEMIGRAQRVEHKVSKLKFLSRSYLGKILDETAQAMKALYRKGPFFENLKDTYVFQIETSLPTNTLEEIFQYLMGQEVGMIGVCGMAGTGKTTIMQYVHHKLCSEEKFGKSIWVSYNPDIRKLQKGIAGRLYEYLSDYDDATVRAEKVSEMLRNIGSYVLVLDDVSQSFSLEEVGILRPTADNGCKIVLITRSEEVVRSMGCKKVQVNLLSMDEAFELFTEIVGKWFLSDDIKSTIKLIIEECQGRPLAIVTIAQALKGIHDDLIWKEALKRLRSEKSNDVEDMFGLVGFIYDILQEEDKECFLHCALYPEGYAIPIEEMIEYWIEEGLIDEMETRETMKSQGLLCLGRLEERSFLQKDKSKDVLILNDALRDITKKRNPQFFVQAGRELEVLPDELKVAEDLEKVSLMQNFISEIPSDMYIKSNKLTTLLLSGNSLDEIPESFFNLMHGLKYLDLSRNPMISLPNSISNLENLTALLLRECENLVEVPSLSKLRALKKLNLEKTKIREVPQGMELLENLIYLNLRFISTLEDIPCGLLSELHCLQHLVIHPTLSRAEEIMELKKLEIFEGRFTDVQDLSLFVDFLRRQRQRPNNNCSILVGKTEVCSKFFSLRGWDLETVELPPDVQQLEVERCSLGYPSLINGLDNATDLRKFRIVECEGMQDGFHFCRSPLKSLESLVLRHLKDLKVLVAEKTPHPGSFSSLKVLILFKCTKIQILFSTKWVLLQDLSKLEQITVWGCDQMEEIIASEEEEGTVTSPIKFTLPNLRELSLWHLPKLKSICGENRVLVCDSLQKLEIWNCPKLKRIPLQLYLPSADNGQTSYHPSLKGIRMKPNEWKSIEWEHPDAKEAFVPLVKIM